MAALLNVLDSVRRDVQFEPGGTTGVLPGRAAGGGIGGDAGRANLVQWDCVLNTCRQGIYVVEYDGTNPRFHQSANR